MQNDWCIISSWDPQSHTWNQLPEPVQGNPNRQVRSLLGGKWTRSFGNLQEDMSAAYWNAENGRKVFVLRMPKGMSRPAVERVMQARAA